MRRWLGRTAARSSPPRWPSSKSAFRPPCDDRERDRAWRMLVRKGYEPELAYEAVRQHARSAGA